MFRIRRVYDDATPWNREVLAQVQAILRAQFPGLKAAEVEKLPEQLRNPLAHRFRSILFVAEQRSAVHGFALLLHAPDLSFCFLDYLSAGAGRTGGGIGGALYERVREDALGLGTVGLFMECLPDDPALCRDPAVRAQNRARLKFYEHYGTYPIVGTAYETPIGAGDDNPPYLVFDDLGTGRALRCAEARDIVRAILERKYGRRLPRGYVERVVASFEDDPVRLREPRYASPRPRPTPPPPRVRKIALLVNDEHSIHHARERGYVEAPVRVRSILEALTETGLFERLEARHFGEAHIKAVHQARLVEYLKRACRNVPPGQSVYPYVFPLRRHARPPKELPLRAGYYCIDTFTPLNANAYPAAIGAVDCALTAAHCVLEGHPLAYALVRPPGHHAERASFGGFCYFNSAAIAAHYLSRYGTVAVLDVDYHHGNGTQDIFYERADVLTVSLHGHPRHTYPYFSGYEEERGYGPGAGFNLNIALPEGCDADTYRGALEGALRRIARFKASFLVVSLGLDTAKGDPTGSLGLVGEDLRRNGALIGGLRLPTVVVQEGGYKTRTLGGNARHFFAGLWESLEGTHAPPIARAPRGPRCVPSTS